MLALKMIIIIVYHNQCQYDDILMENISVNRERQISVGTAGPQLRVQDVR